MKLSVVLITKNEEEMIGGCLDSISWANEKIVVDDYSTDRTAEVAKQRGAKVIRRRLDTIGKQKQYAISKARGEWVLLLDADERVSPKLRREIKKAIKNPEFGAYNVWFHQYFLGEPLRPTLHGGHPRLFRRGKGRVTPAAVHERIIVDGKISQLQTPITHYSHQSVSQLIEKFNRYTDDEALILHDGGSRSNWIGIFVAPFYTFFRRQFTDKDFLSGIRGLVLSILFSLYTLMKWLKVWEIEYRKKKS